MGQHPRNIFFQQLVDQRFDGRVNFQNGKIVTVVCNVGDGSVRSKVLGGGQPITNSTVTLWAASEGAPQQIGQARTGADGSFTKRRPRKGMDF